jgi:hypothetical protein
MALPLSTSYVLHSLLEGFHETVVVAFVVGVAAVVVEPEVVFAAVDIPYVSEPQASVHIVFAFVVLIPGCVLVFEVDSPGPPRFFVLPTIFSFANSSSSVEIVDMESVHSSNGVHTNYDSGSNLSNVDLR